jgi:hypothetical protein
MLGKALRGNLAKRKAGGAAQNEASTDTAEASLRRTDRLSPKLGGKNQGPGKPD